MNEQFAKDVKNGLSADRKHLSSKYFYNDAGSHLFREIMDMPEYYLTNCELEIFTNRAADIYQHLNFKGHFNLIELGAGDGLKTAELIRYLLENKVAFTYQPIDISQEANDLLLAKLQGQFPDLKIAPKTGDYFEVLKTLQQDSDPSLLMFIGSNIGNYQPEAARQLFTLFHQSMKTGDKLLVGVDLKKNPRTVRLAYDDPHGITKQFNLNLLTRINDELGGHFDVNQFDFYATYDPDSGDVKSYIVSLVDQEIEISHIDCTFQFKSGETIWTELSKKYDLNEFENLLASEGFNTLGHFCDSKNYFSDSLFVKP